MITEIARATSKINRLLAASIDRLNGSLSIKNNFLIDHKYQVRYQLHRWRNLVMYRRQGYIAGHVWANDVLHDCFDVNDNSEESIDTIDSIYRYN